MFTKEYYPNKDWVKQARTAITCKRATFKLPGEEKTSVDIVDEFAEDHEVWANAFIEGWQVLIFDFQDFFLQRSCTLIHVHAF